ncbi:MAG: phage tail tube protein [Rhodobacterales bacterium]
MSTQARGAKAQILIQQETAYKTLPTTPAAQRVNFISCDLRATREQEQSQTLRGDRNPSRAIRGNTDVAGNLVTELQAYNALLWKAILGSVTTSGEAAPYTHVFKIGDTLPSLMIEKGFADIGQYFRYLGCKVASMSFSVTPSGFQNQSISFVGAKEAVATGVFDANPANLGKQSFDGFAIATIQEGGVDIANVVGIDNLTINNDLDTEQYSVGGAGERDDLPEGLVTVSGTLRARFTSMALYTKAINDTESSLLIKYQLGTGVGTAGNESLEIVIPELTYAPSSPAVDGPRGVLVELPFVAYFEDGTGSSALQVTLKNTQATV